MKKICTKCNKEKSFKEYHKRSKATDGLRSACKSCCKVQSADHYKRNIDIRKQQQIEWYRSNKEKISLYNANNYLENRDKRKRQRDKHYNENKPMYLAKSAKRRALRLRATIKYSENKRFIEAIYKKCSEYREQGFDFHVDHIVPLNGKNVSGLHVQWNLQIVTAKYNLQKGNKYECN